MLFEGIRRRFFLFAILAVALFVFWKPKKATKQLDAFISQSSQRESKVRKKKRSSSVAAKNAVDFAPSVGRESSKDNKIIKAKVDSETAQAIRDFDKMAKREKKPSEMTPEERQKLLNTALPKVPGIIADFMINAKAHYKILQINESIFAAQSVLRSDAANELARKSAVEAGQLRTPASADGAEEFDKAKKPIEVVVIYDDSGKYLSYKDLMTMLQYNNQVRGLEGAMNLVIDEVDRFRDQDGKKFQSLYNADLVYRYSKNQLVVLYPKGASERD